MSRWKMVPRKIFMILPIGRVCNWKGMCPYVGSDAKMLTATRNLVIS